MSEIINNSSSCHKLNEILQHNILVLEKIKENEVYKEKERSKSSGCGWRKCNWKYVILLVIIPVLVTLATFSFFYMTRLNCLEKYTSPKYESLRSTLDREDDDAKTVVPNLRLPRNIFPFQYKLQLLPFLNETMNWKVLGKVEIFVTVKNSTNEIILHSIGLNINESSVKVENLLTGELLPIKNHTFDHDRDFYNITFGNKSEVKAGESYRIYIEYDTVLNGDLKGFYKSSYKDKINQTKWIALTQFEATEARRSFPCFDEPDFKAKFLITIGRQLQMSSISNMELNWTQPILEGTIPGINGPGWVWDHYINSLPMSTYLVAYVVSDYSFQETLIRNSIKFRVWSRPELINQTDYALTIGPKLVEFFEGYFGIDFPLSKLDMIAVNDLDNGAMENWGLITFKETEMLYDPNKTSKAEKNVIVSTIAHEVSHQWFGNLVTLSWWSDLWLNEGFASYFEYVGTNHVEPTWNKMQLLNTDEIQNVFVTDSLDSTHPISINVQNPNEINEIFDSITYSKGASIIGMLNNFLGESTFRRGLHLYLNRWKYKNTKPEDLWAAFTEAAHGEGKLARSLDESIQTASSSISVADIMSTWTLQKGLPILKIARNYETHTALFTQIKYSLIPTHGGGRDFKDGESKSRWWIPVSYAAPNDNPGFNSTEPKFWISKNDETVEKQIPVADNDWFVVNVKRSGYFRVNYDMRNWQLLENQLRNDPSKISVENRAQILDDALNLAKSSLLPYAFVFSLTNYLREGEREFSPWVSFLDSISHLSFMLQNTPADNNFKNYIRDIIEVRYGDINLNESSNSTFQELLHQQAIVAWACNSAEPRCINLAKKYFQTWKNSKNPLRNNPVPSNIRKPMFCTIVQFGGQEEWDFFLKLYKQSELATEKKSIIQGLSCSKDVTKLQWLLKMAVSPDTIIPRQDGYYVLKEVALNPRGISIVFDSLMTDWPHIVNYLNSLDVVIAAIGDQFNTKGQLRKLIEFKKTYAGSFGPNKRSVSEAIEKTEANIIWMKNNYGSVVELLKKYSQIYNF